MDDTILHSGSCLHCMWSAARYGCSLRGAMSGKHRSDDKQRTDPRSRNTDVKPNTCNGSTEKCNGGNASLNLISV